MSIIFEPIESKEYPGFYEIQGHSRYVINRNGTIIIRKRDSKKHYINLNADGYLCTCVLDDVTGKRNRSGVHKLVALAFHGPAPICGDERITVNHKNCIKTDNCFENLEWCTQSYNSKHAWMSGLLDDKLIKIYVRNELTGEEKIYKSIEECSKAIDISGASLQSRLRFGPDRVWPGRLRFRKDGFIFKILSEKEINDSLQQYKNLDELCIYTFFVKTGQEIKCESISECAFLTGISSATLRSRLDYGPDRVWPGYIRYRKENQTFSTLTETKIEKSLTDYKVNVDIPIYIKWFNTGKIEEFKNLNSLANFLKCSRPTIRAYANNSDQLLYRHTNLLFQVQRKDKFVEWRQLGDVYDELEKTRKLQQIIVTDEHWNFLEIHESIRICSRKREIDRNILNDILQYKGESLFHSERFMRELDYYRHFGKPDWLTI
jgi:hypothetical protein